MSKKYIKGVKAPKVTPEQQRQRLILLGLAVLVGASILIFSIVKTFGSSAGPGAPEVPDAPKNEGTRQ